MTNGSQDDSQSDSYCASENTGKNQGGLAPRSDPYPINPPAAAFGPGGSLDINQAESGITEEDVSLFDHLTSVDLTAEEERLAALPDRTAPEAKEFLAVHWHPEWAPLPLIERRLAAAFPVADKHLVIPTQHNKIMVLGPWAGVEADVYDRRYGLKVQLLIHFKAERLKKAGTLVSMMEHTYNYRALQLLDILDRLINPKTLPGKVKASIKCSVDEESITLARFYAARLKALIEKRSDIIGSARDEMLKNRLLPDFILASTRPAQRFQVEQALMFIKAVKDSVKKELRPHEFYSPEEVIEEARSLGAGVVIPHPPAFWPILLSNLDIDGWEVWNPSTPHHTLFLADVLERANEGRGQKRLLAFMGDDTHMSAKFRRNLSDEKDSLNREIGFQDPWTDPAVAAALTKGGQSLTNTLNEYRSRLD